MFFLLFFLSSPLRRFASPLVLGAEFLSNAAVCLLFFTPNLFPVVLFSTFYQKNGMQTKKMSAVYFNVSSA